MSALQVTFKPKEVKKPKLATCKSCKGKFVRTRPLQSLCLNLSCVVEFANRSAAKRERVELKVRREAIKTRSDYLKETQIEFNRFIRTRDAHLPCISCGRTTEAKINAGHFLSVGSHPQLRFNENNCHKQCEHCNTYLSGNQAQYRMRLIPKIGLEAVEALECDQTIAKWSIDDLKAIKATYKLKTKELLRAGE
jgi:hypothetical protein